MNFLSNIGFGFIEVGTLTPKPQPGNPKPGVFRIIDEQAIINHLGFNNKGIDYAINQIKKFNKNIPIGINIGKNATTDIKDAFRDYEYCLRISYSVADYITLNISSPNTKNLRDFQSVSNMESFLVSIKIKPAKFPIVSCNAIASPALANPKKVPIDCMPLSHTEQIE